jgi:uncharacterized membrane protein
MAKRVPKFKHKNLSSKFCFFFLFALVFDTNEITPGLLAFIFGLFAKIWLFFSNFKFEQNVQNQKVSDQLKKVYY